jgi:hypothetical protein
MFMTLGPSAPSCTESHANKWFTPWVAHFRQLSTDPSWQALVTKWKQFELLNPPDGVSFQCFYLLFFSHVQRLPTMSRPEEVQWWIKRKRLLSLLPSIENPSEYGTMWRLWWVNMQPAWRGGELLGKILPADGVWEPLVHGGLNGLFIVVVALSWWVNTMGRDGQHPLELSVAINDTLWVLSELIGVLAAKVETGKKHGLDESNQKEGNSKK